MKSINSKEINDIEIIELINENHPDGFRFLYYKYYDWLCIAAYTIIKSRTDVEDVVQEVFMELWKKKDKLKVEFSFKYYLRRAVINRALNQVKKVNTKTINLDDIVHLESYDMSAQKKMENVELNQKLKIAINTLPEKRRKVFKMSRYEEMSYREIAEKLNISTKTVENQISSALKTLRKILK